MYITTKINYKLKTNMVVNWSKIKSSRSIRLLRIWIAKNLPSRNRDRVARPSGVPDDVKTGLRIWFWALRQPDTELLYDPVAHECYLHLERAGHPLYMILEGDHMRIINSVIGYDIKISGHEYSYAEQGFFNEVHKRRQAFRKTIYNRVQNSLVGLYQDLLQPASRQTSLLNDLRDELANE
jgi:hypothetical protein